jgi:CTP:molybdopterin cytidylyltransferase MocA
VAGLVLAAGAGRRYGGPKALVEYEGERLVDRAVGTLRAGGADPVVVVLGAAADEVRAAARLEGCTVLENPDWDTGMGSSLRAGLAALAATDATATVVLLVDMPGITPAAVRRVAGRAGADALATAGYRDQWGQRDRWGHPVLLGREHWPGVAQLAVGDVGARPYLRNHAAAVQVVACGDVAYDDDLDTPDRPIASGGPSG